MDISNTPESGQAREPSDSQQITTEQAHDFDSRRGQVELLEEKCLEKSKEQPCESVTGAFCMRQVGQPPEELAKNSVIELSRTPPQDLTKNHSPSESNDGKTSAKSVKRKYPQKSPIGSTRVLRSRVRKKPKDAELGNNTTNVGSEGERVKKKRRYRKKITHDEFSRARKHLRYLLHRISYEQNLIDVYSGEGWKGQSVEKIKLEKELQRAKVEILRRKLKIRDLFQKVDSMCAEGRIPESLFDAEGEIDSEDIFCAKCQLKDVTLDNDIILCDGICERGFHQFCLDPPLLKVPDGDEGWLCPGCDCKVDCIDLLNESQGTNLSIGDSWECIFPEAASAAAGGNNHDQSYDSSDDSDDNDYDPDGPEVDDESVRGGESSSSESDFTSASGDLAVSHHGEHYLGLPSDDSEDDDYSPGAPDSDEQNKPESSSSDFTSDSEDLTAALEDAERVDGPSSDHRELASGSVGQRSKIFRSKNSMNDEPMSALECSPKQDDSAPVSGKRHVERLDYKKLYDETYGNGSDSSDDEDWDGTDLPGEGNNGSDEVSLLSPNGKPLVKNMTSSKEGKLSKEFTPRRTNHKLNAEGANISANVLLDSSSEPGSIGRKARPPSKRLGDTITQELYKHFKENQYPDRATKENLAKELGLRVQQVSKWFENARWSFRHPSSVETSKGSQNKEIPNCRPSTSEKLASARDSMCNGDDAAPVECRDHFAEDSALAKESSSKKISNASITRQRKGKSDSQAQDQFLDAKTPKTLADSSKSWELRSSITRSRDR